MGNASGNAYQFRVRSCSGAACSAWANGPKFTLQPFDDAGIAPGQFKGTWTSVSLPGTTGAYGGTVRRASGSATATLAPAVTFSISGNAAWVSTLGPDQGLGAGAGRQRQAGGRRPLLADVPDPARRLGP